MSALDGVTPPRRIERAEPPHRIGERPHRDEHEADGRRRREPDDEPPSGDPDDDLPHVDVRA